MTLKSKYIKKLKNGIILDPAVFFPQTFDIWCRIAYTFSPAMQIINPTQAAAGAICSDNGERFSKLRNVLNNEGIEVFLTLILLYELWT